MHSSQSGRNRTECRKLDFYRDSTIMWAAARKIAPFFLKTFVLARNPKLERRRKNRGTYLALQVLTHANPLGPIPPIVHPERCPTRRPRGFETAASVFPVAEITPLLLESFSRGPFAYSSHSRGFRAYVAYALRHYSQLTCRKRSSAC